MFVVSTLLALREVTNRVWVASTTIFVSAVPYGPPATASAGLFGYESEASKMAQDLSQVAVSRVLAGNLLAEHRIAVLGLSRTKIENSLSAASNGRTVTVTVTAPTQQEATALDQSAQSQLVTSRATYLGPFEAARSDVRVISPPKASQSSSIRHAASAWLLRLILGAVVAFALALAWDYLDDTMHSPNDLERWLYAPVLARLS